MGPTRLMARGFAGLLVAGFLVLLLAACRGESTSPQAVWAAYARIVAVEDARGERPPDPLFEAARHPSPRVRGWAFRGMGRLGDPALADSIATGLGDPDPGVRVAAAHALATAATAGGEVLPPGRRLAPLQRALGGGAAAGPEAEEDPRVRGELGYALVRASRGARELTAAARVLDGIVAEPALQAADSAALAARLAVARGYHRLGRVAPAGWWAESSAAALELLADTRSTADSLDAARIRRLAVGTLRSMGALDVGAVVAAMGDADPGVRRQGVMALVPDGPVTDWVQRLQGAMTDPDPTVRFEALRGYGRWARPIVGCVAILQAVDDGSAHVVLEALDLLAEPCRGRDLQLERLMGEVLPGLAALRSDAPGSGGAPDWHRTAHALASLASVAPDLAGPRLADAARHPNPFFRAWVARAATEVGDGSLLRALATDDPDPNVRTAAIRGLGEIAGHGADALYRAGLGSDDGQLVMTAADLLEDTPEPEAAAEPLAGALRRFTAMRSETTRDVRMALLGTMEGLGVLREEDLRPLLTDYDPVVATRAAGLLEDLTGSRVTAAPEPLDPVHPPDGAELQALARSSVVLEMEDGGEIEIRLRPDWAATNAARFARLARDGYYDGLTFHRVEPAFVIQGGSPGANEYAGADRYTRDELGLAAHWEGTVGVSTRGPDTGDGQIFVNLVDNVRLDHQYTVFGEVVRGMDLVHRVLEGDVIWSATVTRGSGR